MPPNEQLSTSPTLSLAALAVRVLLPLVGVALLMTGLVGVVSYGLLPALDAARARDWHAVEATVESVSLTPASSGLHPQLETVEIRYTYVLAGRSFTGVRYDPHNGQFVPPAGAEALSQMKTSPKITVWVDPESPAEAFALRELRWPVLMYSVPALVLAVIGGLMLFAGMVSWVDGRAPLGAGPRGLPDRPGKLQEARDEARTAGGDAGR